jgi:hypothetical protein
LLTRFLEFIFDLITARSLRFPTCLLSSSPMELWLLLLLRLTRRLVVDWTDSRACSDSTHDSESLSLSAVLAPACSHYHACSGINGCFHQAELDRSSLPLLITCIISEMTYGRSVSKYWPSPTCIGEAQTPQAHTRCIRCAPAALTYSRPA